MSSSSLTLQCRQCSGIFATPQVDFNSLVKCPHCATAAPVIEFAAIQDKPPTNLEVGQSVSAQPPLPKQSPPTKKPATNEGDFSVRGKWLQFDCPHCVRPMRLVVEDAGGLVDCAHCGLELIAPDPTIGRGAKLSRSSEGRVGSVSRISMRDLRSEQLSDAETADEPEAFGIFEQSEEEEVDPNHSLARSSAASPPPEPAKRAVKALESTKLGQSFRKQNVAAQKAIDSREDEWSEKPVERPGFGESKQDRLGFWIALGVAGVVMTGIIAMVIGEAGKSNEVFDDSQLSEIQSAQKQQTGRFEKAFQLAKEAMASPTWEALTTHVRNPERVAPLMRSFYAKETYTPVDLKDFHAPLTVDLDGKAMLEMRVNEVGGKSRTLVIEESESGLKLDWELMVNLPAYNWNRFLKQRPEEVHTVNVIASQASVLDKYFSDAGLDRDEAIGIRLWQGTADGYYSVVTKDSELGKTLTAALEWDTGRKIIVEASFDPESQLNDRIRVEKLVQTGWIVD